MKISIPLTEEDILNVFDEIAKFDEYDYEAAHSLEDDLMKAFINHVANVNVKIEKGRYYAISTVSKLRTMARLIAKGVDNNKPRHCA